MSEIESRLIALEGSVTTLSALIQSAQLQALAANGKSDAAASRIDDLQNQITLLQGQICGLRSSTS